MPQQISWDLTPTDSNTFTGAAYTRLIGTSEREIPMKLYYVRFEPAARTNWHAHSGPQILVVCSGRCRYQRDGEPVREIGTGESVRFEGGERHWHGAAPEEGTEHIAVNLDPRQTQWMGPVSEPEYGTA